jgi:cytochrome c oxidase subunit 4
MSSIKLYTVIFGVLAGFTTVQYVLEQFLVDEMYWIALAIILGISTIKALSVAGWYMHLFDEPRSIAYVAFAGLLCVIALTAGAAYSVQ